MCARGKEIGALWKPGRGGIGVLQDERGFDTPGFVVECIPCVGCGNVGHWKSRMGRRVQGTREERVDGVSRTCEPI